MDFITGLPKVYMRDCMLVVVDRPTKFAHFFAISATYTAMQVADLLFREVFRFHGLSNTIVSDRDSMFLRLFWQDLFKLFGTKLTPSTSYHPQTDGQTEDLNKWVEGYLKNYVSSHQNAWVKWLHMGEFCYNSSYHMSIKMSPFKAIYGYDAPNFTDLLLSDSRMPRAQDFIAEYQDIMRTLKNNI